LAHGDDIPFSYDRFPEHRAAFMSNAQQAQPPQAQPRQAQPQQAQPQNAPPPAQTRPASAAAASDIAERSTSLSLEETLRVLDVARSMRAQRQETEMALNRDQVRGALRHRLIESAKLTGDTVSEAEIDAAVDQYFDQLYAFEPPKRGWRLMAAKAWIHRTALIWSAALLSAGAAAAWWFGG
jgi:pyruvate/2-oxoglutarate dehydrogenase complex dihydrolipoamide acyltransferase (E2) component